LFEVSGRQLSSERDRTARAYVSPDVEWSFGSASLTDAAWGVGGGRVLAWTRGPLRVELALITARPYLPPGMWIDAFWLGVWRLRSTEAVAVPPLVCLLLDGGSGYDGGPESGEDLDAQTWSDGVRAVSIGTEDPEALSWRAHRGDSLPSSWASVLEPFRYWEQAYPDIDPIRYLPYGIAIDLPTLPAGELCEVHHVAAWVTDHDAAWQIGIEPDVSTWRAVDSGEARRIAEAWTPAGSE
jgi:hypothetical protein